MFSFIFMIFTAQCFAVYPPPTHPVLEALMRIHECGIGHLLPKNTIGATVYTSSIEGNEVNLELYHVDFRKGFYELMTSEAVPLPAGGQGYGVWRMNFLDKGAIRSTTTETTLVWRVGMPEKLKLKPIPLPHTAIVSSQWIDIIGYDSVTRIMHGEKTAKEVAKHRFPKNASYAYFEDLDILYVIWDFGECQQVDEYSRITKKGVKSLPSTECNQNQGIFTRSPKSRIHDVTTLAFSGCRSLLKEIKFHELALSYVRFKVGGCTECTEPECKRWYQHPFLFACLIVIAIKLMIMFMIKWEYQKLKRNIRLRRNVLGYRIYLRLRRALGWMRWIWHGNEEPEIEMRPPRRRRVQRR